VSWDPARTAEFFDEYGEREWRRFEEGITPAAGLDTHVRFLERFVRPGDRVLDAGAGPGRFTAELVRLGADAVALDISPGQLDQLRARLPGVEAHVGDVTDLSRFADDSFDVTLCLGGPLSYVLDRAEDTLAELVRVTRRGGHVLVSVMSLVGTLVHYLSFLLDLARRDGTTRQEEIVRTGFLPEAPDYGHLAMKLYRWSELEALLSRHGAVVAAAAAGLLPDPRPEEPELRQLVHLIEAELCEEPGAVSCGQHILAALRVSEDE
jgi:SAM-dependent methyltransferase